MKAMTRAEFLRTTSLASVSLMLGGKAAADNVLRKVQTEGNPQFQLSAERARQLARQNTLLGPVTAKGKIGDLEISRLILGGKLQGPGLCERSGQSLPD